MKANDIRKQIEELEKQLAAATAKERDEDLATMKELQKKHRFSKRELGNLFKFPTRSRP